jgi:hypothetical protein
MIQKRWLSLTNRDSPEGRRDRRLVIDRQTAEARSLAG